MVDRHMHELHLPVARVRLEAYRPPGGTDEDMMVNYLWNLALSEALYPALGAMEVALRNSIHAAATSRYRTDLWFELPDLLQPGQLAAVRNARDGLIQRGKDPSADRIVAELHLGFWTTILSRPYHPKFWNPNRGAMLKTVFPRLPIPLRQRHLVHRRYNDLRFLRNRVFHYEPIWNRSDLPAEHARLLETIGWISPAFLATVELLDRFPDTSRHGRDRIRAGLRSFIDSPRK